VIRIGTRGSPLALVQANLVAAKLRALGLTVDIVTMRTEGDRVLDRQLAAIGGKGLFVREIEEAMLRKEIDVAVHSLKDLPAETPDGLVLGAYLEREDARDVLVTRAGGGVESLRRGAVVGTSSPRRQAILLSLRPDVTVESVRGNVETRLRKLEDGRDAVVLASAGLRRLGLSLPHVAPLDPDVFVPAVGQGIIAVEARQDDRRTLEALARLDDARTHTVAAAERACLGRLGASCVTPMAAYATIADGTLAISGFVASEDGRRVLRARASGASVSAVELGRGLAESLLAQGAAEVTALHPPPGDR
jgi:hydroxymethylbilane synthase